METLVLAVKAEKLSIGYLREDDVPLWVVRNVDLEIMERETFCLIGESGCGKTTLANAIAGVIPPHSLTAGKLYIFDKLVIDGDNRLFNGVRGKLVSYIPQNPGTSLNPYLTIKDHFYYMLRNLHRINEKDSVRVAHRYLQIVGLSKDVLDRYPHELSGGMQQRVTIALALASGARILVADEPTSSVDAHLKYQILSLLDKLVREHNLTLIMVTHEIPVAQRVCNRIAVMYAGKIVEIGEVSDITRTPMHPYTIMLLETTPVLGHMKPLKPFPGEPLDFSQPSNECPLYARCPLRDENKCRTEPPLMEVNKSGHYVRCWLVQNGKR
ncbi:MAG: ABC transporter ATP-binding protein [Desulfurococcaceae archaeon]